jgi:hypothetical protein
VYFSIYIIRVIKLRNMRWAGACSMQIKDEKGIRSFDRKAGLNVKLKVFNCTINCVRVRSRKNEKYEISFLLHQIVPCLQ